MEAENSHTICTWDAQADCAGCTINGELHCKWDRKVLTAFYAVSFPPLLIAIFAMVVVGILTGTWWMLIAYVIYIPLMLGFVETRFLCSHCPYYAREGRILHCLANHGDPKIWRYRPGPMNRLEKFLMAFAVIALIFFIAPLAVETYGIWFAAVNYARYGQFALLGLAGLTAASLLGAVAFVLVLGLFFCSRCVNFSCPFNTVPKNVIDEYLKKNDVMRKAWEASGWQIE